jgi:hypothetical protein
MTVYYLDPSAWVKRYCQELEAAAGAEGIPVIDPPQAESATPPSQ